METLIHKILKVASNKDKKRILEWIQNSNIHTLKSTLINISSLLVSKYATQIKKDSARQDYISQNILTHIIIPYCNKLDPKRDNIDGLTIMDIGGGNGNVLHALNKSLKLPASQCICLETDVDWLEPYERPHTNITYQFWDHNHIPIEADHSVDIALCMVSLHHMTDDTISRVITEVKRLLKPGGLLLIKEHDASSNMFFMHWEHYLYHILECAHKGKIIDPDTYMKQSIHNFKPKSAWKWLIETETSYNLEWQASIDRLLTGPYKMDEKNVTRLYWDIYVRDGIFT